MFSTSTLLFPITSFIGVSGISQLISSLLSIVLLSSNGISTSDSGSSLIGSTINSPISSKLFSVGSSTSSPTHGISFSFSSSIGTSTIGSTFASRFSIFLSSSSF